MPSTPARRLREQGLIPQVVTAVLRYETHDTKHYCMFCGNRTPLFISRGRVMALIYGNSVEGDFLTPPVGISCKECGAIYKIRGLNQ